MLPGQLTANAIRPGSHPVEPAEPERVEPVEEPTRRRGSSRNTPWAELLKVHESSPGTTRSFCGRCGTRVFFRSDRWPGETHVPLAAFDEPVDRPPQGHAFWDEHVAWLPFEVPAP